MTLDLTSSKIVSTNGVITGVAHTSEINRKALTAQVTYVARDCMATRLILIAESDGKGMI